MSYQGPAVGVERRRLQDIRRGQVCRQWRAGHRGRHHDYKVFRRIYGLLQSGSRGSGVVQGAYRNLHRRRVGRGVYAQVEKLRPGHGLQLHQERVQPPELDKAREAPLCRLHREDRERRRRGRSGSSSGGFPGDCRRGQAGADGGYQLPGLLEAGRKERGGEISGYAAGQGGGEDHQDRAALQHTGERHRLPGGSWGYQHAGILA